jgi:hypothetical protein
MQVSLPPSDLASRQESMEVWVMCIPLGGKNVKIAFVIRPDQQGREAPAPAPAPAPITTVYILIMITIMIMISDHDHDHHHHDHDVQ